MTRKIDFSPQARLKKMLNQKYLYNGRVVKIINYRINKKNVVIKTDRWLITCTHQQSTRTLNDFLEIDFK